MQRNLIFDLGVHRGEDTEFYLKKGFSVVAVDANPELCRFVEDRFPNAVADRKLTVVNRAITQTAGRVEFYQNLEWDVWGTIDPESAERNARQGAASRRIVVEGVTTGICSPSSASLTT